MGRFMFSIITINYIRSRNILRGLEEKNVTANCSRISYDTKDYIQYNWSIPVE